MKVLSSILVGLAAAQWEGFDYSDYSDVGKNQASQVQVYDVLSGQVNGNLDSQWKTNNQYLGNGQRCWFCNERSVRACFDSSTFTICQGQEYFCFYHERRKISHYFNRREKYIDNFKSTRPDGFLQRQANEAHNQATGSQDADDTNDPATSIHVMAGCQQPQACLRQQSQNNPITIGVAFYGSTSTVVGYNGYAPTSRRNVREGLCRLGKDWTYYSGHNWAYEVAAVDDPVGSVSHAHTLQADRADGHQFFDERESWYNGMRPNGFPIHFHGGKGTESVCHFCCNPDSSSDGPFCNRMLLDKHSQASGTSPDQIYANGSGVWADISGAITQSLRADNEGLQYGQSPAMNSWNTNAGWLKNSRYHGMWRNPETQVLHNINNSRYGT